VFVCHLSLTTAIALGGMTYHQTKEKPCVKMQKATARADPSGSLRRPPSPRTGNPQHQPGNRADKSLEVVAGETEWLLLTGCVTSAVLGLGPSLGLFSICQKS
jgi:hypothetical protein